MHRKSGVWVLIGLLLLALPATAQKRLWVLRAGEMIEYDPGNFLVKQRVKVPGAAAETLANLSVNRAGQILFVPTLALPLSEEDAAAAHKAWLWNGGVASSVDLAVKRESTAQGSNQAVTELAGTPYLSADGAHLYWFANSARRLQREGLDLSTLTTWQAWRTDLTGAGREEMGSVKMPECRCSSGSCEETCPYGVVWVPDEGVDDYFFMTQFVAGKNGSEYKATTLYQTSGEKWSGQTLTEPLRRVLDAASGGSVVVNAIPDTGCCGWSNQSNDQTLVLTPGKVRTVFDEQATYKNPDYDVSFYTENAKMSPDRSSVAMTIVATAQANQTIQLSDQGQANPEEQKQIRKALADLPAVEVKSVEDTPRRISFLPHATLVGWINDKEVLIVEEHLLVVYNMVSGARRKSTVRVDDVANVFLR